MGEEIISSALPLAGSSTVDEQLPPQSWPSVSKWEDQIRLHLIFLRSLNMAG